MNSKRFKSSQASLAHLNTFGMFSAWQCYESPHCGPPIPSTISEQYLVECRNFTIVVKRVAVQDSQKLSCTQEAQKMPMCFWHVITVSGLVSPSRTRYPYFVVAGVPLDAATAAAGPPGSRGGQLSVAIPRPEQTSNNRKDMISMLSMHIYRMYIYIYVSLHIPNIQDDINIM